MKLKSFFIGLAMLMEVQAQAYTEIICSDADYMIRIKVDLNKANPPQSPYKVFKGGEVVREGSLTKVFEGYIETFLSFYAWEFMDGDDALIGVGTTAFKTPVKGSYEAKSDLFIVTEDGDFSGSTVQCAVNIL